MTMQTYKVSDVTEPETIIVHKKKTQGNVHGITILGKGNLEGEATISLILNGAPYKKEYLSGNVDFKWGGDWYSDSAEIRYTPIEVTSGSLKLKCQFADL